VKSVVQGGRVAHTITSQHTNDPHHVQSPCQFETLSGSIASREKAVDEHALHFKPRPEPSILERSKAPMTKLSSAARTQKLIAAITSKFRGAAFGFEGPPGIGKTHTAQHTLDDASCLGLSVHATAPLATLIQRLPRASRPLPLWATHCFEKLERHQHVEPNTLVASLVAHLTTLTPVIVHLEDLHEATPEQLEMWQQVARQVNRTRGLGLLATSRTALPEPFERLTLEPLSFSAATALLEAMAHSTLPDDALTWVNTRAHGNPLFVLEYFRHLTRLGFLWSDGRCWRWRTPPDEAMPSAIEALIMYTLETVRDDEASEAALHARAMSPLGTTEAHWAAVAALSLQGLRKAVTSLENAGILRGDEFVHPLYREVTRQEMPVHQQRIMAQRLIAALEKTRPDLAVDFVDAAGWSVEDARTLFENAVEYARNAGHKRRVATLLARMAKLETGAERSRLALEAAQVMRPFSESEAAGLAALAYEAHPVNLEALILHAKFLARGGQREVAEQHIKSLAPEVLSVHRQVLTLIDLRWFSDRHASAVELWQQHPEVHAEATPSILGRVFESLVLLGRLEEAQQVFDEALRHELSSRERMMLFALNTQIPLVLGKYEDGEIAVSTALAMLEAPHQDLDMQRTRCGLLGNRSVARSILGRYQDCFADLVNVQQIASEFGFHDQYLVNQVRMGECLTQLGEYERAEEVLLECVRSLEHLGNPAFHVTAEFELVRLYLDWDPPHGAALALRHAALAEKRARLHGVPNTLCACLSFTALAEARHGQPERALEYAREIIALAASTTRSPINQAIGVWLEGLSLERLGQPEAALHRMHEGVTRITQLHLEHLAFRMALEVDRFTGDLESARTRLRQLEARELTNLVNITHRYFPQLASSLSDVPRTAPRSNLVRLEVLGPARFSLNGRWSHKRSRLNVSLLAVLLEAHLSGRHEVKLLDLLDVIYPTLDEDRAVSSLHQLVYRMRCSLGQDVIRTTPNGYALGAVESDAEDFLEFGDVGLWRGAYLSDLELNHDSSLREALYHALRRRAAALLETQPLEATRVSRMLLEANAFDLEALWVAVQGLLRTQQLELAEALYQQSRTVFDDIGEQLPSSVHNFVLEREQAGV
jgi:tetratricopeptide (TPR) repeat protein